LQQQKLGTNLYHRLCCLLLFFVAASASFQGSYTKWHFREAGVLYGGGNTPDRRFDLGELITGTAERPFVYRQMLPTLANWIDRATPTGIKERAYAWAQGEKRVSGILRDSPLAADPLFFVRYSVVYFGTFLFAWLATCAMYLVCKAAGIPPVVREFAPVVMILLMPYFQTRGGYFYDYPELAFLALAVWMSMKFPWGWMLPVAALAAWNKESFLFFVPTLYPLLRKRTSQRQAMLGTALLGLVSGAVYVALRVRFAQNPGATVLHMWEEQFEFFLLPKNYIDWEKTYGIPGFRALTILPLVMIVWTVWRGWKRLPVEIQRHGQIAAALNLPLFFLFCKPGELRDLSLLYVTFLLLLAVNMASAPVEGPASLSETSA
jgi:hypothetical protein